MTLVVRTVKRRFVGRTCNEGVLEQDSEENIYTFTTEVS